MRTTRRAIAGLAALTALVALSACSDDSDDSGSSADRKAGATNAPGVPGGDKGASANAKALPAAASGATFVALGDSYAAGVKIPVIVPAAPPGCSRSESNYAHLVARQHNITGFVDATCGGARTPDMTAGQQTQGSPPPQFDALRPDTALVTLGIGGNDIGFSEIVTTCVIQSRSTTSTQPCTDKYTAGGNDELAKRIAETGPKIAATIAGIKERSPKARILVVGYPTILPESGPTCPAQVPVAEGDLPYLRKVVPALNDMLAKEAAKQGAEYVDTYAGSAGHDVCRPAGTKWVEGIKPEAPAAPVHPNALGQEGMAKAVLAKLG
ncbi:SGNH/GDSL hydrolase family protein [Embleya scabrispora]|uniref:SGNH/GDSL hydrolase family protein n=1 Tax=Embleya scabrispora TaxID=159449 RepID=UPI00037FD9CC|nr:SGNH/GDSL hydrolase family protein [Embleya scabrispora]